MTIDPLNTPHQVTVGAPLLRPGLTVTATCSERYVPTVAERLLDMVAEINGRTSRSVAGEDFFRA